MSIMNTKPKRDNYKDKKILSQNPDLALRELVSLTQKLLNLATQETQCLITNDLLHFAYLQQDKDRLANRYAQASEEFRLRMDDFRKADKSILMKLEKIQAELHQKAQENNALIDDIKSRAKANTKATLFSVQELGQRIHMQTPTDEYSTQQRSAQR